MAIPSSDSGKGIFYSNLKCFFYYDHWDGVFSLRHPDIKGYRIVEKSNDVSLIVGKSHISGLNAAVYFMLGREFGSFKAKRINKVPFDNRWENIEVFENAIQKPEFEFHSDIPEDVRGYIYCYTNKETNEKYIGKTINPSKRHKCHLSSAGSNGTKFAKALLKHGANGFYYEILQICYRKDMQYWEAYYIDAYKVRELGYNMAKVRYKSKRIK